MITVFSVFALFFSVMFWATAAPLRRLVRLEERVDVIVKNVDNLFASHGRRLAAIEVAKNGEAKPEGYRENANQGTEDEPQEPKSKPKPPKPFVYGQKVDVLLGDDGFEDVNHPLRPAFSATFLGFGKGVDAATAMVLLKVGEMPMESFQLSEIQLFHPEAP